jgi:hypothetical protein
VPGGGTIAAAGVGGRGKLGTAAAAADEGKAAVLLAACSGAMAGGGMLRFSAAARCSCKAIQVGAYSKPTFRFRQLGQACSHWVV